MHGAPLEENGDEETRRMLSLGFWALALTFNLRNFFVALIFWIYNILSLAWHGKIDDRDCDSRA